MEMKNEIYHLIRNDIPLRVKIARFLGITDASVYNSATRKAPRLTEYPVVKIIMEHTGKSEEEIFEKENLKK